jgi:putative ABC transport system substrate-binding protein
VALGLAASLARPGGNVTGVTNIAGEIAEKYLELLLAAAPNVKRVGFLLQVPSRHTVTYREFAHRSATQYLVEANIAEVAKPRDFDPALSRFAKDSVQGLVLFPNEWYAADRSRIVKFALAQRWPVIAGPSSWVEEGALLSYGANRPALYRRAAFYVDRILRGTKPGDLPIEQPTRFDLIVNMKTAKAIGLTISQELLLRATRVIE